jgi:hypothetical protein
MMVGNASLLSALYLASGAAIEALRRAYPSRWAERASLAMESLPARVLELLGAMGPLQQSYAGGKVNELGLRLIFGATVVALIFVMAVAVGLALWGVRWLLLRQTAGGQAGE